MGQLHAIKLFKVYKKRNVVNNVSLTVNTGEVVGLLGPNGAGKTTCFYMMVGLIAADSGQISLNKHSITNLPMHLRARLGISYLPQEASIFRKLTVEDNILAILETRTDLSPRQRKQELTKLLVEFNIEHIQGSLGMSLSGGERRRVEIARALANQPKFMLLDEPFAGVDPISISDIKTIIQELQARNIGVLITDHNVRDTLDICERATIINEGRVIAEGPPDHILDHDEVRKVYLGQAFNL